MRGLVLSSATCICTQTDGGLSAGSSGIRGVRAAERQPDCCRSVLPINQSSTARTHRLPSRITQTTSDFPRRMSPAENTPGMLA